MSTDNMTESVLRLMIDKPRELTAFASLIAGLRHQGLSAELTGSPERQESLYSYAPTIPVDAEIEINGVAGFVDHTVVPAPQENPLRVATQDTVAHDLINLLTAANTMRWIGSGGRVRVRSWALSGHGGLAVDRVGCSVGAGRAA
ncbi:hypothetical protein, partial [Streptomyces halstedii]|uniref:hypothetical protein n=1 Tax=Streptomyces halstedii TaxID=1944 RepID=UPI00335CB34A